MIEETMQITNKRQYRQFLQFLTTDSSMVISTNSGKTVYLTNELSYDERIEVMEQEVEELQAQMDEMQSE